MPRERNVRTAKPVPAQSFEQRKYTRQSFVGNRSFHFIFKTVRNGPDDPQIFQKVPGGVIDQPQQHTGDGIAAQRHLAVFKDRHRVGLNDDDLVFEEKRTGGCHPEDKFVIAVVASRLFQNHSNMITFVFHTRYFVFVECRIVGVFVDAAFFDQKFAVFIGRIAVKLDRADRIFGTFNDASVGYFITFEHNSTFAFLFGNNQFHGMPD